MSERFIFTRHRTFGARTPVLVPSVLKLLPGRQSHSRTLAHRTRCYHCGEDADQIVKAVSAQAQVICSACGAIRIFIPRFEDTGTIGTCTAIGRYDLWTLEADGRCKNCGVTGPHALTIGCSHFTTRCRNCGYTHFYRFSLEYIARYAVGGTDEVSAPRGP